MKKRNERVLRASLEKIYAEKKLSLSSFDRLGIKKDVREIILGHSDFVDHLISERSLSEFCEFVNLSQIQSRLHFDKMTVMKLHANGDDWVKAAESSSGLKKSS
jgi:hypothetical protein